MLENQVVHSRISELLSKLACTNGFNMNKVKGAWGGKNQARDRPTLSDKL